MTTGRAGPAGTGTIRPQAFGRKHVRDVRDPLIEPLWEGERLIVEVVDGRTVATDVDGRPVDLDAAIAADLATVARASRVVLDAYLTAQAGRSTEGAVLIDVAAPTATEMTTRMLVGGARTRRRELAESLEEADPDAVRVLVAVDLLVLDEETLLDVPLLERKRLLESVLGEGEAVRIGAYVRPPVDAWLGTWRALGFRQLAYKAANSRYRPGEANDAWATIAIPQR